MNSEDIVTEASLWAWEGCSPGVFLLHISRYHLVSETSFLGNLEFAYSDFWKDVLLHAIILILLNILCTEKNRLEQQKNA